MQMIPPFQPNGYLPPGIHEATWQQAAERLATNSHRRTLLQGLLLALLGGELFPADWEADEQGRTFLEFFQTDQQDIPKGIIAIDLGTLP